MTPQLVDHTHTDSRIVIGCNLVQSRATSQKNEHVYFWLQSHRSCITVAVASHTGILWTTLYVASLSSVCVCVCVCVCLSLKLGELDSSANDGRVDGTRGQLQSSASLWSHCRAHRYQVEPVWRPRHRVVFPGHTGRSNTLLTQCRVTQTWNRVTFMTQWPSDPGIQRPGDPVDPVTLFYNELQMSTYVADKRLQWARSLPVFIAVRRLQTYGK